MVLLVAAAIFLAGGWAGMAETTADAAYFALVIGAVSGALGGIIGVLIKNKV